MNEMPEIDLLKCRLRFANSRIEALEAALSELADLMDDVVSGGYKPDSFTTQPARAALVLFGTFDDTDET